MGKIRKTYDIHFKKKVVYLHLNDGMGYHTIAREMNIDKNQVRRGVNYFQAEGIKGLEEKRGKAKGGTGMGRPRICPEDPESKIKRLNAENEMLKKFLNM
ncbi:helix-turn-helix domain-containing protein [Bacillus halotolerans]|uniref:Helix-turn-helix domain-containing protein n=1 Tax=Bacillus halotolerans TaxID=260554 RepID=A0ABY7HWG9_9BACI|nr:helix-turn-helix domain-containing protein [Bacillus halotolerans]MBV5122857.1 helix-turn-helix domain-containing protein [Bacillus halotolerans]MDG0766717.1 helix-turn-helix domain-containing protein [Bacillus halotolerans]UUI83053.1 helix-turn-helix domain-containing protein [Bacillus halotolerans]WAT20006.1 helix-turn-helix domain-containing protein [Bacillus halotolerans]